MEIELNTVYNEDCLVGMKSIKDKSIDIILCDLPYGTTRNHWDIKLDTDKLWEQYERIIKDNGVILLFAQSPFDKVLACTNLNMFRYEWIWEKSNATGFMNSEYMPLKAHENILVFYKKRPTYNPIKTTGQRRVSRVAHKTNCKESSNYGKQSHTKDYDSTERYPRSVLKFKSDKQIENFHPTQKPMELLRYFIETYSNKGDTLLDNCCGAGGSLVAAKELGRNYIGYETEKEYFDKCLKRLQLVQGSLF